jgi:hypothetical protein
MAGLGAGSLSALIAAVVGTSALFIASPASYGIVYLILDALPALGLVWLAMRHRTTPDRQTVWTPEGPLLEALVMYPCLIFIGVILLTKDHNGGLLAMSQELFHGMTDQVTAKFAEKGQTITPDIQLQVQNYLDFFARIVPSVSMYAWLFSTALAMGIAQLIITQQGWALRPSFALEQLRLPHWILGATILAGLAAALAPAPFDYLGLNLALVLGMPFLFTGLAIVHVWAAQTRHPTLTLVGFYVICSAAYPVLLVALLGAVDQGFDFRKKLAARAKH